MFCELCDHDIVRGTMYSAKRPMGGSPYRVCRECRDLILYAKPEEVNEPMCACGKLQAWVCEAAITAPCKPNKELL